MDSHEDNLYAFVVPILHGEWGEIMYNNTGDFPLIEGGVIDLEGNLVVGANSTNVDFTSGTITFETGPNTVITPAGTLEAEGKVVVEDGKVTITGNGSFIQTGVDDDGRPSVDAGGTVVILGEGDTTIDPHDGSKTIPGGSVVTMSNGDVIITTGEALFDRGGNLISTNDPYVIVKRDAASLIGTDSEGRITAPENSTLVLVSGDKYVLIDGGAINYDKSIEIAPKKSVELPNGDVSIFPEGGRINPDGSTTSDGFTITVDKNDVGYIGHNKDGSTNVPENTVVTTPTGDDYTLPEGGIVLTDDTIKLNNGGSVVTPNDKVVDFPNGGIFDTLTGKATPSADVTFDNGNVIGLPQGGTINDDQSVNIGNNNGATLPNNDEIILPEGGRIDSEGNITTTGPIVRVPNGTEGEASVNGDGTINVPKGTEITDKDGNKTVVEKDAIYDPATGRIAAKPGTNSGDTAGAALIISLSLVASFVIVGVAVFTVLVLKETKKS